MGGQATEAPMPGGLEEAWDVHIWKCIISASRLLPGSSTLKYLTGFWWWLSQGLGSVGLHLCFFSLPFSPKDGI